MDFRSATKSDYPAIADVYNAAYPADSYRTTAADIEVWDASLSPRYKARRLIASVGDNVAGVVHSFIPLDHYHPRKFAFFFAIHPNHQGQGVGKLLYDHFLRCLEEDDPISLRTMAREDMQPGIRFLESRGYEEEFRSWESVLELEPFDESRHAADEERVRLGGITIHSLSDFRAREGWDREIYELHTRFEGDMPSPEPYEAPPFEDFAKVVFGSPKFLHEGCMVAVAGSRFVGVSTLLKEPADETVLTTDVTGVDPDFRRMGVATALKLHGFAFAKRAGYARIRTYNESTNRAMLSINERLGFRKLPGWIGFVWTFKEEP